MSSIYVASLADYNAGTLHGEWIDFDECADPSDVWDKIKHILAASPYTKETGLPAEEWAIHDYEDFPEGLGENPDIEKLWEMHKAIEEHGEAFSEYAENIGVQYATVEGFEEAYRGQYRDMEDYAYELVEECGYLDQMPDSLRYYFDYKKFARDLEIDGYFITKSGHVFCNC